MLVEGNAGARGALSEFLCAAGFSTLELSDAESALAMMPAWEPEVLLLESQVPGIGDHRVLRDLKSNPTTQDMPIILLGAMEGEEERVRGLQHGADDCVGKSGSAPELIARMNALLRRSHQALAVLTAGKLVLEARSHRVTAADRLVPLRPAEFRLLHFFMTHPDTVHSRTQPLHRVWQFREHMEQRSIDVHVRRLQKALEPAHCDHFIQTVRSVGYRFSTHTN